MTRSSITRIRRDSTVVDWNISVKASLDQVAGLHFGNIIELPRVDIAHFNPAHIYSGKTKFSRALGRDFDRRDKAKPSPTASNMYRAWTGSNSDGSDENDFEKEENGLPPHRKGKVYLVVALPPRIESRGPKLEGPTMISAPDDPWTPLQAAVSAAEDRVSGG